MTVIGFTGHQDIPPVAQAHVDEGIREELRTHDARGMTGACSLAAGADQLFARLVLEAGGSLSVVVPCEDYESTFDPADLAHYEELLDQADEVEHLDFTSPSEEAFLAAGHKVVAMSDLLIAVWDGESVHGKGGTGDIVAHSRASGVPVKVIWPSGIKR